ncbi:MAG: hypothetical protein JO077_11050 [Verrucomicrobia bacterium]|nr:hypothetical protein [Verrucomicrobiota bacterium]
MQIAVLEAEVTYKQYIAAPTNLKRCETRFPEPGFLALRFCITLRTLARQRHA